MAKKDFKPGTMLNPVPVVPVSCGDMENSNIITIAWTGIINSEPPMTYISVRRERYSHDIIEQSGEFVINLCTKDIAFETDLCGVKSGRDVDKFELANFTKEKSKLVAAPAIAESPVNIECKIQDKIALGSHDMFIAKIVNVKVDEDLIDEKGRILLDKAGLVAYCHGEYIPLAEKPIGSFGWSVMKKKTKKRRAKEGKPVYNRQKRG